MCEGEPKNTASSIDTAKSSVFRACFECVRADRCALHKLNPVRLGYIRDKARHALTVTKKLDCLKGLRMPTSAAAPDFVGAFGAARRPEARVDPSVENIDGQKRTRKKTALLSIIAQPPRRLGCQRALRRVRR